MEEFVLVLRVCVFTVVAAVALERKAWPVLPACAGFVAVAMLAALDLRDWALVQSAVNAPLFAYALLWLLSRQKREPAE